MFEMLCFISTSPTIPTHPNFVVQNMTETLRGAIGADKKTRGEKVGEILSSLTEAQRQAVKMEYVGANEEALQVIIP